VIKIRILTSALRQKLKAPLGLLIRGSTEDTIRKIEKLIKEEKPSTIISVGDVVSESMIKHHILPQVLVVDNKVMREPITPISINADRNIQVKNPPGTIMDETWIVMEEAVQGNRRTKVLIDGEEDLLALVAIFCAPIGSLVVYGQPKEGIVAVKVTEDKKEEIHEFVEAMEKVFEKAL